MWFFNVLHLSVLLVGAITAVYLYTMNQFSFWKKRGVTFLKPHWIFGNFGGFITAKISLAELSLNLHKKFKNERFAGVWRFYTPMLWLVDPALIRNIMVKDFDVWSSRGIVINEDTDPLSGGLVNLDGKRWKAVRTKMTPTFTSGKLKQMHHLLVECGKAFEQHLDSVVANGGVVEAREMSARFTTDVIGSCAFGIQMNSLSDENSVFRNMGRKIFDPTRKLKIAKMMQGGFPWLFKFLKISLHLEETTEFFLRITRQNFEYRDKNNVQRHDFMDLLRNLRNTGESPMEEDKIEFDEKLLAAQAFVFFAAGFETSSTAISFCLHELAHNQDIQDRLREEVHKTKASNNGDITWDALKNMKYLHMVFQETLRKYPPIPMVIRNSIKPYQIPDTNVNLPSGTQCVIPIYALQHDPEYFPDPEKFDPERFTEEAENQRPAFTFLPFGGGPRVCIGLRFAEQQTKMALVKLVDNFKISVCEKSRNPLQLDPSARFLNTKGGIWVRISKNSAT